MPNTRIALSLAALLLGATALSAPANAGWFDFGSSKSDEKPSDKKAAPKPDPVPAQDLDGSIRQAQLLRTDGHYDDAIKHLSQLMLVAADDPRVVTEYGKTLAAMGRGSEAVNFLTRAQQLSPNDWSVYSALGVAYDQKGDQHNAQLAYEHALALKPGDASVLNNYALSRMLAKDPDGARKLIARAESAGGGADPKIARNITMIQSLAPETGVAAASAPHAVAQATPSQPTPRMAVTSRPMPQVAPGPQVAQSRPFVSLPQPTALSGAPRPLVASNTGVIQAQPQPMLQQMQPSGVVMQRVPVDPLAGPVGPKIALHLPPAPKAAAPKVKQADAAPAPKTAAIQASDLEAKAEAIARQMGNGPAAKAQAMAQANKPATQQAAPKVLPPEPAKAAKPSDAKPVVKEASAKAPVKTADAKPATKPAEAKAVPVKAAAKDAVPALRVSASTY